MVSRGSSSHALFFELGVVSGVWKGSRLVICFCSVFFFPAFLVLVLYFVFFLFLYIVCERLIFWNFSPFFCISSSFLFFLALSGGSCMA